MDSYGEKRTTQIFNYHRRLLVLVLSCLSILQLSCSSRNDRFFTLLDETDDAAKLVQEANEDLKQIKRMYKENEGKIEQIKQAMKDNRTDEVKKIADDLVYIINDGMALGESALKKINRASEMNINKTYKDYLQLKRESLQKQLEAFEYRRQAAVLLRDSFGTKDKFEIEKAKSDFRQKEENFRREMEIARQLSAEANQLAKEVIQNQSIKQ